MGFYDEYAIEGYKESRDFHIAIYLDRRVEQASLAHHTRNYRGLVLITYIYLAPSFQ